MKDVKNKLALLFIKGVSEKTHGFNRGMNRASDAHFSTQLIDLVPTKILSVNISPTHYKIKIR